MKAVRQFLSAWPELGFPFIVWSVVLALVGLRALMDRGDLPVGPVTLGYICLCLLSYAIPLFVVGKPLPQEIASGGGGAFISRRKHNGGIAGTMVMACFFTMACLLYVYSRRSLLGLATDEARAARTAEEMIDPRVMPIYALAAGVGLSGVFLVFARGYRGFYQLIFSAAAIALGAAVYKLLGTRYEIMIPAFMIALASFLVFRRSIIVTIRPLTVVTTFTLGLGLVALNTALSISGFQLGAQSSDAARLMDEGNRLTGKIFNGTRGFAPLFLTVGLVDLYAVQPIGYLDYYLKVNDVPPAMGSHELSYLMRRFGDAQQGADAKARVDDLYISIGIPVGVNVWATMFREIAIDAGVPGSIGVLACLGAFVGLAKRRFQSSRGAQYVVVYWTAMACFSPFSSLIKSNMMQMAFYISTGWLILDLTMSLANTLWRLRIFMTSVPRMQKQQDRLDRLLGATGGLENYGGRERGEINDGKW